MEWRDSSLATLATEYGDGSLGASFGLKNLFECVTEYDLWARQTIF